MSVLADPPTLEKEYDPSFSSRPFLLQPFSPYFEVPVAHGRRALQRRLEGWLEASASAPAEGYLLAVGTLEPRIPHAKLMSFEGVVPKTTDWRVMGVTPEEMAHEAKSQAAE